METKLFLGTRLTPDLKMRLGKMEEKTLQLIPFEGKEYIGLYLNSTMPTLQELRKEHHHFMERLQKHLPDLRTDTLAVVVFPQAFLG